MHEVSVYLNSKASSGASKFWEKQICKTLFRSNIEIKKPQSHELFQEELTKDIKKEVATIICVGGDGTMNTALQKLAGSNCKLLVIPAGTANDLAHELGNTEKLSKVLNFIRTDNYREIDIIKVNNMLMATNGGIGLASNVACDINNLRAKYPFIKQIMKYTGKSIYSIMTAIELALKNFRIYELDFKSPDYSGFVKSPIVLINNQMTFGGNFKIAPQTKNNDGKFNVSIFTHQSKTSLTQAILKIKEGLSLANDPHFISFETNQLKLKSRNHSFSFFGDGETLGKDLNEIDIDIIPKAIKVYTKPELSPCGHDLSEVLLQ